MLSRENEWKDVVGPNKKCYCNDMIQYKYCCLNEDFELLETIIECREERKKLKKESAGGESSLGGSSVGEVDKKLEALYI